MVIVNGCRLERKHRSQQTFDLFICTSFDGAVSKSEQKSSKYWMQVNNELKMMSKEAVLAKLLSWEENRENHSHGSVPAEI
jgi:hypothetical protein